MHKNNYAEKLNKWHQKSPEKLPDFFLLSMFFRCMFQLMCIMLVHWIRMILRLFMYVVFTFLLIVVPFWAFWGLLRFVLLNLLLLILLLSLSLNIFLFIFL